MNAIKSCPSDQQLQDILRGRVSVEEADSSAEHLEACAACAERIEALGESTDLVGNAMYAIDERMQAMMAKMEKLGDDYLAGLSHASTEYPTRSSDTPAPHGKLDHGDFTAFLAPAQAADEIGRLGPYRILRILGAGGMGVVYQAEDTTLKRLVALKAMRPGLASVPSSRQRFLREAQAAAAVRHDHVVTIYQAGEEGNVAYLAMEFLAGETLESRLKREGTLPPAEVLRIGREIAEGLAAAHERGLVHRDIKPANIWLESVVRSQWSVANAGKPGAMDHGQRTTDTSATDYGPRTTDYRVKLLDFGLARPQHGTDLTSQGAVIGTPAYMSPEQANGEAVDFRTDLFSLGVVLYRMSTGRMPFQGKDTLSILRSLANDEPAPARQVNPALPENVSALIMQLMNKSPSARPASAHRVAQELAKLERTTAVAADFQSAGAAVGAPTPRNSANSAVPLSNRGVNGVREVAKRRWPLVAAAMLLIGVILAGTVFTFRTRHGTLVLTVAEPDVKVFIDGEEKVTIDSKKFGKIELGLGQHKLVVKRGNEELYTESFTIKSGERR